MPTTAENIKAYIAQVIKKEGHFAPRADRFIEVYRGPVRIVPKPNGVNQDRHKREIV